MTIHQPNKETIKSMPKTPNKVSKSLIYIPLFSAVLVLCNLWLHSSLSFVKVRVQVDPTAIAAVEAAPAEPAKVAANIGCEGELKTAVGGVFHITPMKVLISAVQAGGGNCADELCVALNELKSGTRSTDVFYSLAESTDPCLNAVLKGAVAHHATVLSNRPVHLVFFDDGDGTVSSSQLTALIGFLKQSVDKANDRLLLIGRSNPLGSELSNHNLARQRAEALIEKIKIKYCQSIQTDFVYFGYHPPRLSFEMVDALGISPMQFRNVRFPGSSDPDFSLRLNQSVVIVPYASTNDLIKLL